jgi:ribonuclease HI
MGLRRAPGAGSCPKASKWFISDAVVASWTAASGQSMVQGDGGGALSFSFVERRALDAGDMGMSFGGAGASEAIAQAFLEGKHVAVSDASATMAGRASWSVGIFDPMGRLVADERGVFEGALGSSEAEGLALEKAMEFLDALGAREWVCFSDSQSSVSSLARAGVRSGGSLVWVPRECVKPANDRARAALGLRQAAPSGWLQWLEAWGGKPSQASVDEEGGLVRPKPRVEFDHDKEC